jgi:hypothetical protein
MADKIRRATRSLTATEAARYDKLRRKLKREFPPAAGAAPAPSPPGLPARIRAAREARGLTWYAVAKLAGIPNSATVRDIEYGRDTKVSNLEAVARALGLQLELVPAR